MTTEADSKDERVLDFETVGCSRYGADMGRFGDLPFDTKDACFIRRVPIDSGGYDPGGAYWGAVYSAADKLWMVESAEGANEGQRRYMRRATRGEVTGLFPGARWVR